MVNARLPSTRIIAEQVVAGLPGRLMRGNPCRLTIDEPHAEGLSRRVPRSDDHLAVRQKHCIPIALGEETHRRISLSMVFFKAKRDNRLLDKRCRCLAGCHKKKKRAENRSQLPLHKATQHSMWPSWRRQGSQRGRAATKIWAADCADAADRRGFEATPQPSRKDDLPSLNAFGEAPYMPARRRPAQTGVITRPPT